MNSPTSSARWARTRSSHFVTDTVEDELAYGMESLGLPPEVMRRRVEETLDLLGLAAPARPPARHPLRRPAAAGRDRLGPHPAPPGARPGRADLRARPGRRRGGPRRPAAARPRPRHDGAAGRAPPGARPAVRRPGRPAARRRGGRAVLGTPADVMAVSPVFPPVVDLGRLAGWSPLPLTVRDARRRAGASARAPRRARTRAGAARPSRRRAPPAAAAGAAPAPHVRVADGSAAGRVEPRLRGVDLTVAARRDDRPDGPQRRREVDAARHARRAGRAVRRHGARRRRGPAPHLAPRPGPPRRPGPAGAARPALRRHGRRRVRGRRPGRAGRARHLPGPGLGARCPASPTTPTPATCPRASGSPSRWPSSSTARPPLLLLDEPTRGLDYAAKARLVAVLRGLAAAGHAIVLATHDVELAAELAAPGGAARRGRGRSPTAPRPRWWSPPRPSPRR